MRQHLIAQETGTIFKKWHQKISVALVFPNSYEVGMSNLGFQTIYSLLNTIEHVVCERVFLEKKSQANECISIESGRSLNNFDIIAFSLFIENDYLNLLHALALSDISMRTKNRQADDPLIMAGGVITFLNPEPVAPFIDFFFIGEAECLLPQLFERLDLSRTKKENLDQIESLSGIYIPERHHPGSISTKIHRQYISDITHFNTCSKVITPNTTFTNTFLIEVSRGCPHGCRYCAAGYVYRPPRFRTFDQLSNSIEIGKQTVSKIAFLGAAVSDLPFLNQLCEQVYQNKMTLALSSFRADAMSDHWIAAAVNVGVKTMTIAPDAGSERLRKVVNKGLTESDLLACVEKLVTSGIMNIRVYLMIGLPTETWDDIELTVQFCQKMQSVFVNASKANHKIGRMTVSLNCFIPKAWTPFQWAGFESVGSLKKKISYIKKVIQKLPNMDLQVDSPRKSHIQSLLSSGSQEVADLIEMAYRLNGNWSQALKASRDSIDKARELRSMDTIFPWDFIDQGISRDFLANEYRKALDAQTSRPCYDGCRKCGVC